MIRKRLIPNGAVQCRQIPNMFYVIYHIKHVIINLSEIHMCSILPEILAISQFFFRVGPHNMLVL